MMTEFSFWVNYTFNRQTDRWTDRERERERDRQTSSFLNCKCELVCNRSSTLIRTIIDELGELDAETLFDLPNLSVHREGLDVQMSVKQDGSSRGFVDT